MASYIKTPDHLSIVFDDGTPLTVYTNNPNYAEIVKALNLKDWDEVRRLADPVVEVRENLEELGIDDGRVVIDAGIVYLDDEPMSGLIFDRMVAMTTEGFDITPLKWFLVNLQENPSYRAVQELYKFLEKSELPITEDGHFIAYKRVRTDFSDARTGKFDNSPGQVVKMSRNRVNEDPNQTCAAGLHVCSRSYLPSYGSTGGGQVIMVKIHPRDVVAIPNDYGHSKMRVCRYEVLQALTKKSESHYSLPVEELEAPYVDTRTDEDMETAEDVFLTAMQSQIVVQETVQKAITAGKQLVAEVSEAGNILQVFNTTTDAQMATGANSSSIGKVCRGERKKAGDRFWKFIDPNGLLAPAPLKSALDNLGDLSDGLPEHPGNVLEEDLEDEDEECPDCGELLDDCVCDEW